MTAAVSDKPLSRRERRRQQWQTFRRTLPDAIALARPQAKLWALGLVLMLINRLAGLVLPGAPKFLLDVAVPAQDMRMLGIIVLVVVLATVVQGLTSYALVQTISRAGQRLIAQLRLKLQEHISALPVRYYDNRKTGDVVSRIMNDVEGLRNLLGTGMVEFLGGVITAGIAVMILFYLNATLTLAIAAFLVLFFLITVRFFAVLGPIFKERQRLTGEISGRLTESVGGIRVVKAYTAEGAERKEFARGVDQLLQTVLQTISTIGLLSLTVAVLLGMLGALILLIGGTQLMTGELTTGELISYILYLGFVIAPISGAVITGTQLSEAFAGIERMKESLSEIREDSDEEERLPLGPIEGAFRFEDVSFAYEEAKEVLRNVSFDARAGSVTALVGPSGSGKSTLIGLIASFHEPTAGRILLDGLPLNRYRRKDYRRQLGVVLQDNFLFAGTVRENILYARPEASEAELRQAAELAHCMEFIDRFPDGFETVIGERGVKLSGGQRQRLAIARALLANPRVLILDEATSALDSESEKAIKDGLAVLMKGRTTFVIAHRLSTIRNADQILVIEDGQIVERGTHSELLALGGRYHEMYSLQHGEKSDLFLAPGEEATNTTEQIPADPPEDEKARKRRGMGGMLLGD